MEKQFEGERERKKKHMTTHREENVERGKRKREEQHGALKFKKTGQMNQKKKQWKHVQKRKLEGGGGRDNISNTEDLKETKEKAEKN